MAFASAGPVPPVARLPFNHAAPLRRDVVGSCRRLPRIASLPLQFCQASPGVEIRMRSQDSGHAGWVDPAMANVKGGLLVKDGFWGIGEDHRPELFPCPPILLSQGRDAG